MTDTKQVIIKQMMMQEKPFKPRHIWEPLGISRQLLQGYLDRFVASGLLLKMGTTYEIVDKEAMIDAMLNGNARSRLELPRVKNEQTIDSMNRLIDYVCALRVQRNPQSANLTRVLNGYIDDHMDALKRQKKYLNSKTHTTRRASEIVDSGTVKEYPELIWQKFGDDLEFYVDKDEFVENLSNE